MAISRNRHAADIMYRVWDSHNKCWSQTPTARSIWHTERGAKRHIQTRVKRFGRNPDSLEIVRVLVREVP